MTTFLDACVTGDVNAVRRLYPHTWDDYNLLEDGMAIAIACRDFALINFFIERRVPGSSVFEFLYVYDSEDDFDLQYQICALLLQNGYRPKEDDILPACLAYGRDTSEEFYLLTLFVSYGVRIPWEKHGNIGDPGLFGQKMYFSKDVVHFCSMTMLLAKFPPNLHDSLRLMFTVYL